MAIDGEDSIMADATSNTPQKINSGNTTRMESQAEADERSAIWTQTFADVSKEDARQEIKRLESKISNRRLRDAHLTEDGKKWLEDQEALIAAERAKL